jgi:hypothetical protein
MFVGEVETQVYTPRLENNPASDAASPPLFHDRGGLTRGNASGLPLQCGQKEWNPEVPLPLSMS